MTKSLDQYFETHLATEHPLRAGRCVEDGYARGLGLQWGQIRDMVRAHPLYGKAAAAADGRSIISEDNRINIFLLLKYFVPRLGLGDIVEFGAYRGGNALFMAKVIEETVPGAKVYALDTFAGMPDTDASVDRHKAGDFKDVDLAELRQHAERMGLKNIEFVAGLFEDTAADLLRRSRPLSFAHIDCDIYSAVKFSYDIVKPHMMKGGYYVFDDALYSSCIGATEAVEEVLVSRDGLRSEQIFPHFVFRAGLG